MDIFTFLIVVWIVKVLIEDGYTTVTRQPNPRLDRRRARQQSRDNNRLWGTFLNYLGDVADDAREEAHRRRRQRREQEAEARRKRELDEHDTRDAEWFETPEPDPVPDSSSPEPDPAAEAQPADPEPTQPEPADIPNTSTEGEDMPEIHGLDQSIAYAASLEKMASGHGQAGNEGYIGELVSHDVTGEALASAYEMQAAFSAAMAAAGHHKAELMKQKAVQESYDSNPDAGDKEYQTAGR